MNRTALRVSSLLFVVVFFGGSIGAVYAYFLPALFPGYRTIWTGILGVSMAMLTAGYIGYRVPSSKKLLVKLSFSFGFAGLVAYLVVILSWFIVANIRGE